MNKPMNKRVVLDAMRKELLSLECELAFTKRVLNATWNEMSNPILEDGMETILFQEFNQLQTEKRKLKAKLAVIREQITMFKRLPKHIAI